MLWSWAACSPFHIRGSATTDDLSPRQILATATSTVFLGQNSQRAKVDSMLSGSVKSNVWTHRATYNAKWLEHEVYVDHVGNNEQSRDGGEEGACRTHHSTTLHWRARITRKLTWRHSHLLTWIRQTAIIIIAHYTAVHCPPQYVKQTFAIIQITQMQFTDYNAPVTLTSSTAASISLRISWFSLAISSPFMMKCSVAICTAALNTWAFGDCPFLLRVGPFCATNVVTWKI